MDAALSIAASGLAAATTEIAVTSENIANAATPGYVDESAQLAALPGGDMLGIGDGVAVTSVAQVNDQLFSANNLQAQGALSNMSALQQVLTGVQNVFPLGQSATSTTSSGSSTNTSIAGQLANFWSSWDGIAQDPSSSTPRGQVVDVAQGIVTSLNEASTQLSQLSANTSGELVNQVSQVNSLLGQAATLNQQIVETDGGGGNANQLVDQLNSVTNQLAQSAGVTVHTQADGSDLISIGGVAVVQGDQASTLATDTSGGTTSITTAGGLVTVPVTSGTMAGLLSGLNISIPGYQSQLDSVASDLATTVNDQLAGGVTATGASGAGYPLFTVNGGTTTPGTVTASTISVNPAVAADLSTIAAASPPSSPGAEVNDGSNAAAMAELSTVASGPDAAYQQLIQHVGSDTQNANTQVAAQSAVADAAQQALQSATGVDTNTELTNLMEFQASYQASAKLVSVIDTAMQSLLAAV